jgi:hypothetical protein
MLLGFKPWRNKLASFHLTSSQHTKSAPSAVFEPPVITDIECSAAQCDVFGRQRESNTFLGSKSTGDASSPNRLLHMPQLSRLATWQTAPIGKQYALRPRDSLRSVAQWPSPFGSWIRLLCLVGQAHSSSGTFIYPVFRILPWLTATPLRTGVQVYSSWRRYTYNPNKQQDLDHID